MLKRLFMAILCVLSGLSHAQTTDTAAVADPFAEGKAVVNQCTPRYHLKCVSITAKEVYADARQGKSSRHWWRKSYIGQACTEKHGKFWGNFFEGLWAVPHYIGVALANGTGLVVYIFTGSKEDKMERKRKREEWRKIRKERKTD